MKWAMVENVWTNTVQDWMMMYAIKLDPFFFGKCGLVVVLRALQHFHPWFMAIGFELLDPRIFRLVFTGAG